ncbi:16S RNA G1207 methylase RsmC [Klebsiella pneumoniae subsp. pneumoniae MP14]|nr:16S RNA G1207 methylase RsmC [Klebsiella pneumoniae subsp. pneumoniae MP14]
MLINAPNDALVSQLPTEIDASVWTWNYADYQGFLNAGATAHFSVEFPLQEFDQAIILFQNQKSF